MTRKDYVVIARALKECHKQGWITDLKKIINEVSHWLDMNDPKFDWEKFKEAVMY